MNYGIYASCRYLIQYACIYTVFFQLDCHRLQLISPESPGASKATHPNSNKVQHSHAAIARAQRDPPRLLIIVERRPVAALPRLRGVSDEVNPIARAVHQLVRRREAPGRGGSCEAPARFPCRRLPRRGHSVHRQPHLIGCDGE